MSAKWVWGTVILAIAALVLGWMFGMPKVQSMENDIQTALKNAGYDVNVAMSGNVAKLTGELASETDVNDAVSIAQNTKCSACQGKRTWHVVDNQLDFSKLATVSPYTFNGSKAEDGKITLSGFAGSEDERAAILSKADLLFAGSDVDSSIDIAAGAPNSNWKAMVEQNIDSLALLDFGRFVMEDNSSFITGDAASVDVRSRINAIGESLSGDYDFAANITVPDVAAENVGEVKSKSICQSLFDDLNEGQTIEFATSKAEIRGAASFDLLNSIASAAKQCASFRIQVDGHTDNVGKAEYNQWLSEARANTVVAYLNQNEIAVSRMSATGYGSAKPRATNDTAEGRALNRRIEFTVTQSE